MAEKLTLSVPEAANLLGISRGLCYEWVKTGRRLLVPKRALEKLLEEPLNRKGGET